jgi:hypothetical protein
MQSSSRVSRRGEPTCADCAKLLFVSCKVNRQNRVQGRRLEQQKRVTQSGFERVGVFFFSSSYHRLASLSFLSCCERKRNRYIVFKDSLRASKSTSCLAADTSLSLSLFTFPFLLIRLLFFLVLYLYFIFALIRDLLTTRRVKDIHTISKKKRQNKAARAAHHTLNSFHRKKKKTRKSERCTRRTTPFSVMTRRISSE